MSVRDLLARLPPVAFFIELRDSRAAERRHPDLLLPRSRCGARVLGLVRCPIGAFGTCVACGQPVCLYHVNHGHDGWRCRRPPWPP